VIVSNKADLGGDEQLGFLRVSARTGEGLGALRAGLMRALDVETRDDPPAITNLRHIALLERAHDALCRARLAVGANGDSLPEEFVLADLQEARAALEEISGQRTPDDVLAHIFARFCIGK
jgi:tRNA modification GTPase